MKKVLTQRAVAVLVAAMACVGVSAQSKAFKASDNFLVGVWALESMQYEGEQKTSLRGNSGNNAYAQVKIYRKDGEYACVQMYTDDKGKLVISPHEYGTYTYKNGVYTEMGRKVAADGLVPTGPDTFRGRWKNRHDEWTRVKLPEKATLYILERCREQKVPTDISNIIFDKVFQNK